jgi:hypothetical protein
MIEYESRQSHSMIRDCFGLKADLAMTTFDVEGGCLSSLGGGVLRSKTEEDGFNHPSAFGHSLQRETSERFYLYWLFNPCLPAGRRIPKSAFRNGFLSLHHQSLYHRGLASAYTH